MRNPHGHILIVDPERGTSTSDTVHCEHCGQHKPIAPYQSPASLGDYCSSCDSYICEGCAAEKAALGGRCIPIERRIEAMEGKRLDVDRLLRSMGG